jgi:hypothetical protein
VGHAGNPSCVPLQLCGIGEVRLHWRNAFLRVRWTRQILNNCKPCALPVHIGPTAHRRQRLSLEQQEALHFLAQTEQKKKKGTKLHICGALLSEKLLGMRLKV